MMPAVNIGRLASLQYFTVTKSQDSKQVNTQVSRYVV